MSALVTLMKKDERINIRLDDELTKRAAIVAAAFKQSPSGLARVLLEAYCEAYAAYGETLCFPPKFARFSHVVGEVSAAGPLGPQRESRRPTVRRRGKSDVRAEG